MRKRLILVLALLVGMSLFMHVASAAKIRKRGVVGDRPPCPYCEAYTDMVQHESQPEFWFCKECGQESEVRVWPRNPALYR